MIVKLTEIFGTKYFYVTIGLDVNAMFDNCKQIIKDKTFQPKVDNDLLGKIYEAFRSGEDVVFDLSDAVITPDVASRLLQRQKEGFKFIDSIAAWREEILKTNEERFTKSYPDVEELPEYTRATDIKEYLGKLKSNAIYHVQGDTKLLFPLMTIISIIKPSISFITETYDKSFLLYVYDMLTPDDLSEFTEFYMITPEGIQIIDATKPVYIQRMQSYLDINEVMASVPLVPTDFGKKVLFNNGVFKNICNNCLKQLQRYKDTAAKPLEEVVLHGY